MEGQPVQILIVRSWFSNGAAEASGRRMSWAAAILCVVLAGSMAAFPFSLARFRDAMDMADPARWPGLGKALLEVAARGGDFSFKGGRFLPDPDKPGLVAADDWWLVFGEGQGWEPGASPYVRFSRDWVTVSIPKTGSYLDGPATVLEGVSGAALRDLASDRGRFTLFVKAFLQGLASAEVPGAIIAATVLMILQTALFALVLGGFLSLSGLGRGGLVRDGPRAAGFAASVKTAAALAVGPALPVVVAGSLLPGAGTALSLTGYSLLFGLRVILVYMGRFRDKSKAAPAK